MPKNSPPIEIALPIRSFQGQMHATCKPWNVLIGSTLMPKSRFQIKSVRWIAVLRAAVYLRGRHQMIKERLNQAARALLREFRAKDPLGDCQPMSEIDDHRDEIIRLQSRCDFRGSQK